MHVAVEYVYEAVKNECSGMDAIYEDYILELVGEVGLRTLLEHRLLETCGVINGRQLYALCEKN